MNVSKTIEHINKYIKSKGYAFEKGTVENLYLSLKAKPFLLLCGPEGSGKYSLVRLFCESIDITAENGRFKFVSPGGVADNLFNPLGFLNKDGLFCPGEVFEFIIKAKNDAENSYVLYIDDVNIVNPDIYLREILKAMDTIKENSNGILTSEPIFSADYFKTEKEKEMYGNVTFPNNLYIVAGVCTDENCFAVSSKLKDRANIMEIRADNLTTFIQKEKSCHILTGVKNEFLKPEYFEIAHCEKTDCTQIAASVLQEINKPLKYAGKELGYRVRNEILFYLTLNCKYRLLTDDEAFDNCIFQRVLTKIEGGDPSLKNILSLIFKQCVTKGVGDYYANSLKMFRSLTYPDCRYKKSAEKITIMTRGLEERGYCTFF